MTGPSFTRCTFIWAPKRPISTRGWRTRASSASHRNQRSASTGAGRGAESGPHALLRVGRERELRNEQKTAAGIRERAVHAAFLVGKDAIAEHALEQALGLRLAVPGLHRDEREQARIDRTHGLAIDVDARFADTLDQSDHRMSGERGLGTSSLSPRVPRRVRRHLRQLPAIAQRMFAFFHFGTDGVTPRSRSFEHPSPLVAGRAALRVPARGRPVAASSRTCAPAPRSGQLMWLSGGRARRIAERNLSLVITQDGAKRRHVARASVVETGKAIAEIAAIWGRPPERALKLIREVRGADHVRRGARKRQGGSSSPRRIWAAGSSSTTGSQRRDRCRSSTGRRARPRSNRC